MEHVKALAVKLVAHLVLAWVLFSLIFDAPVMDALIVAVIVVVLIYLAGDLVVLRKFGNVMATIADSGAAFLIAWLYLGMQLDGDWLLESLLFAVGVAVFEWFFHIWLLKSTVVPDERSAR